MSAFLLFYLVVFGQSPEGLTQITVLKQYDSLEECQHAYKVMPLSDEQKEDIGCVRMVKAKAKWVEA